MKFLELHWGPCMITNDTYNLFKIIIIDETVIGLMDKKVLNEIKFSNH